MINTLEAEYGKMYRVRLDSVVVVMDVDEVLIPHSRTFITSSMALSSKKG